jgi:hypothetical protein
MFLSEFAEVIASTRAGLVVRTVLPGVVGVTSNA